MKTLRPTICLHPYSIRRFMMLLVFSVCFASIGIAQSDSSVRRTSYKTYPRQLTGRFFLSKKYTDFVLGGSRELADLRYRPNNGFSAGVGASYGIATLNLGFNIGFLDRNRNERGKTEFLDLQSHIYPRKWVIDLYGQFYRGYFISPRGTAAPTGDTYYLRPDMKLRLLGASVYRLLRPDRFSYRAAFLQTEWQQHSAGSWLLGLEAYSGSVRADSAFLPAVAASDYTHDNVDWLNFVEFGPGAGYAYTAVWKRHLFATGSITVNGDLSFVKERVNGVTYNETRVSPNLTLRAVVGYNTDLWCLSLSWVNNNLNLQGASVRESYWMRTGNIRFTIARRFRPGKSVTDRLKPLETR